MSKYITDGDATLDIDDRIEYVKGKPGSQRGKLLCTLRSGNVKLTKTATWDGVSNTEVAALYDMQCFIKEIGK